MLEEEVTQEYIKSERRRKGVVQEETQMGRGHLKQKFYGSKEMIFEGGRHKIDCRNT